VADTGPDTAAIVQVEGAIGPVAADIALAAADIAAAGTAAATEVAAGIGAAAAVATADRQAKTADGLPDRCAASGRPLSTAALSYEDSLWLDPPHTRKRADLFVRLSAFSRSPC
jgi:hypothetical protein